MKLMEEVGGGLLIAVPLLGIIMYAYPSVGRNGNGIPDLML